MNKHKFLTEKAFEWLSNPANSGEQPEFSALKGTTMIFNDNGASDEIEEFLIEQGEIQGVFIEPIDIVNATLDAQKLIAQKQK
jgi:hypothetical protein